MPVHFKTAIWVKSLNFSVTREDASIGRHLKCTLAAASAAKKGMSVSEYDIMKCSPVTRLSHVCDEHYQKTVFAYFSTDVQT